MATFLVVRVTDVALAPLEAEVDVQAARAPVELAPAPGGGPGAVEGKIPPLARMVNVRVRAAGAFEVAQDISFAPQAEAPVVSLVEPASPWVRSITLSSRGPADLSVDVHVIAGGLKDGLTSVLRVSSRPPRGGPARQPLSFPPRGKQVVELVEKEDIVAAERRDAKGVDLLRHYSLQPAGAGRAIFLARPAPPGLVTAWVPAGLAPRIERTERLAFHVHFPDETGTRVEAPAQGEVATWSQLDLLHRALYRDRLALQQEAARRRSVLLVVPASLAPPAVVEDVATAAGLERLLAELGWWIARAERHRWPMIETGPIAVSACGTGLAALDRFLASVAALEGSAPTTPGALLARRLAEVYVLGGPAPRPELVTALAGWVAADAAGPGAPPGRRLRVYHHDPAPWGPVRALIRGAPIARRVYEVETLEAQDERASLVILPPGLLERIEPATGAAPADGATTPAGLFARLFAAHALSRSGLPEAAPR